MSTHPVSTVKARLAEMIDTARATGEPIVITQNGVGTAVLQDLESWESMKRSLAMLKLIAQGERDVRKGRLSRQDEVFRAVRKQLGSR